MEVPKYFIAGHNPPSVTTDAATSVGAATATLNGEVTAEGSSSVTSRGFTYAVTSTNNNPEQGGTGVTTVTEGGTGLGAFNSAISSLTAGTQYSFKAWATSQKGTSYGSALTFTTSAATTATVSTGTSGTITQTSFIISGNNITNTGGATVTERGVVYMTGTSGDPTTSNSKSSQEGSYGTGTYDRTVSDLTASTSYRVRAFAINSAGTAYGSTITVETSAPAVPTVTTSSTFDDITATSATANGNLTNTGGAAVTRRGFCYMLGTTGDPTTANSVAYDDSAGFSTGTYTKGLSSLDSGKKYRVRAYAVNSVGTGYGTTQQLTLTNTAPTVALGTNVVDTATITDTTPSFEFTGTDPDGDDIRYNIQIDRNNTFDSAGTGFAEMDSINIITVGGASDRIGEGVTTKYRGQAFTGDGNSIARVRCSLRKAESPNSPTGNYKLLIYAHSGTFNSTGVPTGSPLGESTAIAASTLSTTYAEIDIDLSSSVSTVNGANYFWVIQYGTGAEGEGWIDLRRTTDTEGGGNITYSADGSTWSSSTSGRYHSVIYASTGGPLLSHTSNVETAAFVRSGDSDPFTSGEEVVYTVPGDDALTADTYYWRVRGMDPTGSDTYGAWSTTRSFTLSESAAAETGKMKVYSGSGWVRKPCKVYNGSTWVAKPLKHYNGSTWEESS